MAGSQPNLRDNAPQQSAWVVNFRRKKTTANGSFFWAKNPTSTRISARAWHWVSVRDLRRYGINIPASNPNNWEVDWAHPENTGSKLWARNLLGHARTSREWHWVTTAYLREHGVNVPVYRSDSWEVNWDKRKGKKVWARNPQSRHPKAREWHWITMSTIWRLGIQWKPANAPASRRIASDGYVHLYRRAMTNEEIALAEEHDLFRGAKRTFCKEHHLVAVKTYGKLPSRYVVRHLNGIKHDNRPENLAIGTVAQNNSDHMNSRLASMYWRSVATRLANKYGESIDELNADAERILGGARIY